MILKNKIAVITGGNSGIGLAIAKEFKAQGATVAIFGRNEQSLKNAVQEIGEGTLYQQGDVTSISDLDRLFSTCKQKKGAIDILVCCAGTARMAPLEEVGAKLFDEVMDVNLKGVYFTVQRSLKYLASGAAIVLITSNANQRGQAGASVYSAAKAGVRSLARTFSAELLHRDIRVNALSPGPVETNIFRDIPDFDLLKDKFAEQVPLKRFAKAEEIAQAALFLASSQSSYVLGAELVVDGGITQL